MPTNVDLKDLAAQDWAFRPSDLEAERDGITFALTGGAEKTALAAPNAAAVRFDFGRLDYHRLDADWAATPFGSFGLAHNAYDAAWVYDSAWPSRSDGFGFSSIFGNVGPDTELSPFGRIDSAPRLTFDSPATGIAEAAQASGGLADALVDLTTLTPTEGFIVQGDTAGAFAGFSVSDAGDINGDGIDDFIVGAPFGNNGGIGAGEAYVIFGKAGAVRANIDLASLAASDGFIIQGDMAGDLAGFSVSSAGDINGDGIDDLIVSATRGDDYQADADKAYVIFGKAGATRANIDLTSLAASDGFVFQGNVAYGYGSFSVSSAGDINGDGIDDLIVGARYGGSSSGKAYVIFGQAGATRANIVFANLAASDGFIIQGDAAGGDGRCSVSSAGDINGDGIDDLIVGARYGGSGAGRAYVIFGKAGATRANIDLTNLAASDGFIIQGDAADDFAGHSVSSAGDINGDGIDDLIVGAPGGDNGGNNAGEAYVIFGKAGATRANIDLTSLAASDGFIIQGNAVGDEAGWSVSAAGDVDGDGFDDLIVGAPDAGLGGTDAGAAYVIFGKVGATRGNIDLTSLATHQGFIIQGDAASDHAGGSVSSAGDINGDGFADVLVGAPYGDNGGNGAGEVYVIWGRAALTAPGGVLNGTAGNDILNGTVLADIVSGLGGSDVIYTGAGNDTVNADTSDSRLDGGSGFDTLAMSLPAGSLNGNFTGTIAGFEALQLNFVGLTMSAATFKAGFAANTVLTGSGSLTLNMDAADPTLQLQQLQGAGGLFLVMTINGSSAANTVMAAPGFTITYNGGALADQVHGSQMADNIYGFGGADQLFGLGGNDTILGDGLDTVLDGGVGTDKLILEASGTLAATITGFEALQLNGSIGVTMSQAQFQSGFAANSVLSGDGRLILNMSAANPDLQLQQLQKDVFSNATLTINGSSAVNTVKSAPGIALTYNGGALGDQVRGSQLADTINGNGGDDKLAGGNGADILTGGAGADTFRFLAASNSGVGAAADQITDFTIGSDKLGFTLIDADAVTPGDQAFAFLGTGTFSNTGVGQIRYQNSGANLLVQIDSDGNGTVDMEVVLQGLAGQTLTSGDFLL
jgi:FG-GAP repeat/RTX calcium-binding nonapeptide repeat (4 copies)